MTHHKLFHVIATFKIKVFLSAEEELANLRSFKCAGIHYKHTINIDSDNNENLNVLRAV